MGFIDKFKQNVIAKKLEVEAVHLHVQGKQDEEYHFYADVPRHLFSGSKAFTSMAVGIALKEGRLRLTDYALDFFPDYKKTASENADKITVKHLLQMTDGHLSPLFSTDLPPSRYYDDWARVFFETPLDVMPGERWFYNNGATYMLGRIVEAVSGEKLSVYLMSRLFNPLEIENPVWDECHGGHSLGAVGLRIKTKDFAKLGRLLLQKGVWSDKEIVPASYIKAAHEDIVMVQEGFDDPEYRAGYGYQLWRCTYEGAFRADGKYGQFSIVIPDKKAVVTLNSRREGNANDLIREVLGIVSS